jgi:hypothetical protein
MAVLISMVMIFVELHPSLEIPFCFLKHPVERSGKGFIEIEIEIIFVLKIPNTIIKYQERF